MKTRFAFSLPFLIFFIACAELVIDPSMDAVQAGDFTLAMSACENVPGGGMDICRVKEGTAIESSWKLVVPAKFKGFAGGEVEIYYKDTQLSFAITGESNLIEIPWKEVMKSGTWTKAMRGTALALVLIRYKDAQGVERIQKFRGEARLLVTEPTYDRLPIDSGFEAFKTTCKVAYSTAGRGALSCK